MNKLELCKATLKATQRERMMAAAIAPGALFLGVVFYKMAQNLARDCAAEGVTCGSMLGPAAIALMLVAVVASTVAISPWGFGRVKEQK